MTREERFDNILNDLMEFDEIFSDFARMGRCIFLDSVKTACISFNALGDEMGFYWNPKFFDECSDYKNAFILCHEMLHIFLRHGRRGKGLDPEKANIHMDISINHLLVDGFGFQRALIEGWEQLCWRDTVFNIKVPPQPSFEGYYAIDEQYVNPGFTSLDEHTFMKDGEDGKGSGEEDRTPLPDIFKDRIDDALARIPGHSVEEGEFLEKVVKPKGAKKPKFEIVVRNVAKSIMERIKIHGDTWASIDRRLCDVCPELPVNKKIEERPKKGKYLCHFYIDNSGSCCDYIERFANCANSLNEKVFEARVYTFDTRVHEVKKIDGEYHIRGGGGTCFGCVTNHAEFAERPPDCVFVLTDGCAEPAKTRNPKKWHWLITECGNTKSVEGAGRVWNLAQFE